MQNTYTTLWQLPDEQGNMQARARMLVGSEVYDETISVPQSATTEADLDAAITARITAIGGGTTTAPDSAQQIVVPAEEAQV
jgi:hypothetical protein